MSHAPDRLLVRDLELVDVPDLAAFAPEDWHMALDAVLLQHIGRPYFAARVSCDADRIVGVGHAMVTGPAGWIGNIIVRPEARNRGVGSRLTEELVRVLRDRGCSTVLLIATVLGEPVYRKLGFERTHEYVFLKVPRLAPPSTRFLRRLNAREYGAVCDLDAAATGEARHDLLAPHLGSGWAHLDGDAGIDGVFLPSFGGGAIVASRPTAGLELLAFKHAFYPSNAVVPAGNSAALQFLLDRGAEETSRLPRMALGDDVPWRPEWVFARAAGYCG